VKRYAIPFLILAIFVAFACWWFSTTQVLKRRTETLLSTLTMQSGSSSPSRQMGGYSLNGLLAAQVGLENPVLKEADGTFDRTEIESAYSWLATQAKQTLFENPDYHSITVDGEKARIELSLEAMVELPTYRPVDGKYEATMDWVKEEDGWRLSHASWKPIKD
jgi:hypothetical protein